MSPLGWVVGLGFCGLFLWRMIVRTPDMTALPFEPQIDPKNRRLDWVVISAIGALHVLALAAPLTFSWSGLAVMLVLAWMGGGLGITLCYHRLLTHRSFKTPKWLEYVLTIIGTCNWQGGPIMWVGTHRLHHAESDQPGDPHTPRHGAIWSHVVWTLFDHVPGFQPRAAAKDLLRDPVMVLIDRYFYVPQFGLALLVAGGGYAVGGWSLALSWVVWGVALRTVVVYHGTWAVNSASHMWGYRNFETTDGSRNNWWVSLLSFGEGWHNNHHAQQRSAAHGMRWWEFDLTYATIRLMSWVGLAWDVVEPQLDKMDALKERAGKTGSRRATGERSLPGVSEPAGVSGGSGATAGAGVSGVLTTLVKPDPS